MLNGQEPVARGQQTCCYTSHMQVIVCTLLYTEGDLQMQRAREQCMLWVKHVQMRVDSCMWQCAYGTCCRQHAARFEKEFLEDMDSLGCRRPDVMTRVSEYMTEIVEYIQTIMGNKMAYESNGSVHFDTQAFRYMHILVRRLHNQVHVKDKKAVDVAFSVIP